MLSWIQAFLGNRSQWVVIGGDVSILSLGSFHNNGLSLSGPAALPGFKFFRIVKRPVFKRYFYVWHDWYIYLTTLLTLPIVFSLISKTVGAMSLNFSSLIQDLRL